MTLPPRRISLLLAFTLLCARAVAAGDCEKVIISGESDYAPLHWYDGKEMRGASFDLAARILTDLHLPYEVRYVGPWKRVLATAQAGGIDLVATLKIQPERERYLDFVPTPALPNPVAVFVDRARPMAFTNWSDLKNKHGGRVLGHRFGTAFEQYASSQLHLEEASTIDSNFRKLALGRIDYFVIGLFAGEAYLAKRGWTGRYEAIRPFVTEDKNYYAFAKSSPCVKYLDAFETRLKELVASKTNLAILNANLHSLDIQLDSTRLGLK